MRTTRVICATSSWKSLILLPLISFFWLGYSPAIAASEKELDLGTVNQLTIGSTTLTIKHPDEKTIAAYKVGDNEPLFQGERSDFQEPAGLVKYRMKSEGSEAALLELHNAGEIDETNFIILIDQQGRGLQNMEFGSHSITIGGEGSISKIRNKFRFEHPAYPSQAGKWMEWSFEKGLRTGTVPFKPKGAGSMNALYNRKDITAIEPLDNAAFYRAVSRLPAEDRDRLLVSMSGMTNLNAGRSGMVDTDIYGLRKTKNLIAFSNCGLNFDGRSLYCFGNDSLAVWERKTGKFYFAINAVAEGDRHSRDDDSLHFFPGVEKWSASAKSQLDDWQGEALWPDE